MEFSGTISITNETLTKLVYEAGMSAAHHGIKKLIIINGHGGNTPSLKNAAQMINRDAHIFTCVDTGEIETSTSLTLRPHLVDMVNIKMYCMQTLTGLSA